MKTREDRELASLLQDPIKTPDNDFERRIYTAFRDNYLLPEMQYKVGHYFLDFAFPRFKIAIEFNGILHNEERDQRRYKFLYKQGWTIYVIEPVWKYKYGVVDKDYCPKMIKGSNGLEETVDVLVKAMNLKNKLTGI